VFEPAGARGRATSGWNCHQFHAYSEFYADFGSYRVEITAPKSYVIGATGTRSERRDNPDGTSTHVFERDDVIDFVWAASPRFVEVTARFSGEKDVSEQEYAEVAALVGRSREQLQLGDVDIHLLLQPEHLPQRERHLRAARRRQVVRAKARATPTRPSRSSTGFRRGGSGGWSTRPCHGRTSVL
jgi:hypothetical protein